MNQTSNNKHLHPTDILLAFTIVMCSVSVGVFDHKQISAQKTEIAQLKKCLHLADSVNNENIKIHKLDSMRINSFIKITTKNSTYEKSSTSIPKKIR